ncbi:hypothetical protein NMY22_g10544 [Coprinellus aureogranulatus]|nr:hypothetical protein NMY22_g10544 [Coprinellus aureogranulatus]
MPPCFQRIQILRADHIRHISKWLLTIGCAFRVQLQSRTNLSADESPREQGNHTAGGLIVFLNSPSRGSVTLRSSDPFDDPVIDDANLQSPVDIAAFKEGFRLTQRFFSGPQWDSASATPDGPYLLSPLFPDPDTTSDAEFEAYLRQTASTSLHAVGTASMSTKDGDEGVVDPELRVKGVEGLRIVDASVIPRVPAGHTQVPVYVLAERAADLIKASWA